MLKQHFHTILFLLTTLGVTSLQAAQASSQSLRNTLKGDTGGVYSVARNKGNQSILSGSAGYDIPIWPLAQWMATNDKDNENLNRAQGDAKERKRPQEDKRKESLHTELTNKQGSSSCKASNDRCFPKEFKMDEGPFKSVAVTSDDRYIVSGSKDGAIRIWDIVQFREASAYSPIKQSDDRAMITGIAVTPANNIVSGSNAKGQHIRIWDFFTREEVKDKKLQCHKSPALSVAVTSDDAFNGITPYIVSGHADGAICTWRQDMYTDEIEEFKRFKGAGKAVNSVTIARSIDDAAQRYIVGGCKDSTIYIWHLESGKTVDYSPLQGHGDSVNSVAVTSDNAYIVSGSSDRTIRIWDFKTGKPVGEPLSGHTDDVHSVAVTRDGKYIVSGSKDGSIRIWDFNTHQQVGIFGPLKGGSPVHSVAVTCNSNKYIVSGHGGLRDDAKWDNTIRIWNLEKLITKIDKNNESANHGHQGDKKHTKRIKDNKRIDIGTTAAAKIDNTPNYTTYLNNPTSIGAFFIVAILICGGFWVVYDHILRQLLFPTCTSG